MQALKKFGLGIIWALLFPFVVVGIGIVGVFGVFNFLIEFVIMVINFFKGKKLFPVYREDQRAYDILQRAIARKNGETDQPLANSNPPQQVFVQQNFYGQNPNQPQLPPNSYQQAQLPPFQQPGALPQNPPQQPAMPQRPELAQLPTFNPADLNNIPASELNIGGNDND